MRFAFTDDQLAFRDAVADLLAKECPPEVVRAAWPDGSDAHGARKGEGARADADRIAKVWSDLAEMGVLGIGVSEAHGGLGMAEDDWVLLAEETGYAALPHPFVETACVVAPLLDDTDDPHGVLAELLDGSRQAGAVPLNSALVPWGDAVTYLVSIDRGRAGDAGWVARRIEGGLAVGDTPDRRRTLADAMDAGRRVVELGAWQADAQRISDVRGTRHNLSATGPGSTHAAAGAGGTNEVCVFCHTPHGATQQDQGGAAMRARDEKRAACASTDGSTETSMFCGMCVASTNSRNAVTASPSVMSRGTAIIP